MSSEGKKRDFVISSSKRNEAKKKLTSFYPNLSNFYYPSIYINDVLKSSACRKRQVVDITGATAYIDVDITTDIYAQTPLFQIFGINESRIKIPSTVEYIIRKYLPRKLLKDIHPNVDVAVEICLLFCSQLTSTYFAIKDGSNPEGWKPLCAKYLREFLSLDPATYKKTITALQCQICKKGAIIECDNHCIIGEKSYCYRFGEAYIGKGIISYDLVTKEAQNLLKKHYCRILTEAKKNPIVRNLIQFYQYVTLPTIDQIQKEGDRLIKERYTKKGKRLTRKHKHSRSYFKKPEELSFVEDAIEIFEYLTVDGLLMPTIGNEASGGRIVDSFTLMPSWIRKLVKIGGVPLAESDYSCLHPNIAINLYGGKTECLTHRDLGLELGIEIDVVKKEHLSFFNKEVWQMKSSLLYRYYEQKEPAMLQAIISEKQQSSDKHKVTSRRLFSKEVEIMTAVIKQLNKEGIFVGYVYDALFFHPLHSQRVKTVMDEVIQRLGIKTTAKLSF